MDSDILEGSPSTEELVSESPSETAIPEGITSAPPAPPVDASSIEPAPQAVAGPVPEVFPVGAAESSGKEDSVRSATAAPGISHIPDSPRVDVSAATVARMMGIASTSDLRLLEGRVDLLTSKVAAILTKMDRCLSMFGSVPTASDIGRLEVQVASMKSMMRELLDSVGAPVSSGKEQGDRAAAQEQSRKLREGIKTNTES
jgi:hypothetical protein